VDDQVAAHDELVARAVQGEAAADAHPGGLLRRGIARIGQRHRQHLQAADGAEAVEAAVVELLLLAEVALLVAEVLRAQHLAEEILEPLQLGHVETVGAAARRRAGARLGGQRRLRRARGRLGFDDRAAHIGYHSMEVWIPTAAKPAVKPGRGPRRPARSTLARPRRTLPAAPRTGAGRGPNAVSMPTATGATPRTKPRPPTTTVASVCAGFWLSTRRSRRARASAVEAVPGGISTRKR